MASEPAFHLGRHIGVVVFSWRCYFLVLAVLFFMFDMCVGFFFFLCRYISDIYVEFELA